MREPLRVGVIGCGTAGAAAAIFLARAGHAVTVFEAVEKPGPVGAGIVLQPTGQSVMARLGLLGPVLERGARIDSLRCETTERRRIVDISYADVAPGLFGLGLHRGVLFTTLFDAARTTPGITMALGVEIRSARLERDHRVLLDARGERHGPFELVVVADGASSDVAVDAAPPRSVRHYPWGALWWIGPDCDRVYRGELYQVVRSNDVMLGLLPTGRAMDGDDIPDVTVYWSIDNSTVDAFKRTELGAWKKEVVRHDPRAAFAMEAIRSHDELLHARYRDVVMPRWHAPGAVWLGDAAHAMSPQLGQGANLALVDASVLSDCIAAEPDVTHALERYTRERRPQLGFYQLATRWLTPFFQGDQRLLGALRDVFMPIACAIPPARGQMVRSMLGIKRGIVRRSLPIEPIRALLPPGK